MRRIATTVRLYFFETHASLLVVKHPTQVQPTVTEGGEKAPALKFGQPWVMAPPMALTMFHASLLPDALWMEDCPAVHALGVSGCSVPPWQCSPAKTRCCRSRCGLP